MDCKNCNGSWNITDVTGGTVRFCPLCGSEIKEEKKKIETIPDCFQHIVSEFGESKLRDSKFVLAVISDYLPGLTVEKRILKTVLESGVYNEYIGCSLTPTELPIKKQKSTKFLIDDYGISDTWAQNAMTWLWEALFHDIVEAEPKKKDPAPINKEPPKPKKPANADTQTRNNQTGAKPPVNPPKKPTYTPAAEKKPSPKKPYSPPQQTETKTDTKRVYPTVVFGTYNNIPIEWLVIKSEGDKSLLLSKYVLDRQKYNSTGNISLSWNTSTLRQWLNNDFYRSAFSFTERLRILASLNTADNNPKYGTNAGPDTVDFVFLLSASEAESIPKKQRAVLIPPARSDKWTYANCFWWLRTPGKNTIAEVTVLDNGNIYYPGDYVDSEYGVVRPAIWIKK